MTGTIFDLSPDQRKLQARADAISAERARLGQEPVTAADFPDRSGIGGYLREIGSAVKDAVLYRFPKDLAQALQGGDVPLKQDGLLDKVIRYGEQGEAESLPSQQEILGQGAHRAVREGIMGIPTPLITGGAGALAGGKIGGVIGAALTPEAAGSGAAPGAALGAGAGAIGGVIGAGAVTYPVFYRQAKNQFLRLILDQAKANNVNLSDPEWESIKSNVGDDANAYGMWAAGPMAVTSAFTQGLFGSLGGKALQAIPGFRGIADGMAKSAVARAAKEGVDLTAGQALANVTGGQILRNAAASLPGVQAAAGMAAKIPGAGLATGAARIASNLPGAEFASKLPLEIAEQIPAMAAMTHEQGAILAKHDLGEAPTWGQAISEAAGPAAVMSLAQGGGMRLLGMARGRLAERQAYNLIKTSELKTGDKDFSTAAIDEAARRYGDGIAMLALRRLYEERGRLKDMEQAPGAAGESSQPMTQDEGNANLKGGELNEAQKEAEGLRGTVGPVFEDPVLQTAPLSGEPLPADPRAAEPVGSQDVAQMLRDSGVPEEHVKPLADRIVIAAAHDNGLDAEGAMRRDHAQWTVGRYADAWKGALARTAPEGEAEITPAEGQTIAPAPTADNGPAVASPETPAAKPAVVRDRDGSYKVNDPAQIADIVRQAGPEASVEPMKFWVPRGREGAYRAALEAAGYKTTPTTKQGADRTLLTAAIPESPEIRAQRIRMAWNSLPELRATALGETPPRDPMAARTWRAWETLDPATLRRAEAIMGVGAPPPEPQPSKPIAQMTLPEINLAAHAARQEVMDAKAGNGIAQKFLDKKSDSGRKEIARAATRLKAAEERMRPYEAQDEAIRKAIDAGLPVAADAMRAHRIIPPEGWEKDPANPELMIEASARMNQRGIEGLLKQAGIEKAYHARIAQWLLGKANPGAAPNAKTFMPAAEARRKIADSAAAWKKTIAQEKAKNKTTTPGEAEAPQGDPFNFGAGNLYPQEEYGEIYHAFLRPDPENTGLLIERPPSEYPLSQAGKRLPNPFGMQKSPDGQPVTVKRSYKNRNGKMLTYQAGVADTQNEGHALIEATDAVHRVLEGSVAGTANEDGLREGILGQINNSYLGKKTDAGFLGEGPQAAAAAHDETIRPEDQIVITEKDLAKEQGEGGGLQAFSPEAHEQPLEEAVPGDRFQIGTLEFTVKSIEHEGDQPRLRAETANGDTAIDVPRESAIRVDGFTRASEEEGAQGSVENAPSPEPKTWPALPRALAAVDISYKRKASDALKLMPAFDSPVDQALWILRRSGDQRIQALARAYLRQCGLSGDDINVGKQAVLQKAQALAEDAKPGSRIQVPAVYGEGLPQLPRPGGRKGTLASEGSEAGAAPSREDAKSFADAIGALVKKITGKWGGDIKVEFSNDPGLMTANEARMYGETRTGAKDGKGAVVAFKTKEEAQAAADEKNATGPWKARVDQGRGGYWILQQKAIEGTPKNADINLATQTITLYASATKGDIIHEVAGHWIWNMGRGEGRLPDLLTFQERSAILGDPRFRDATGAFSEERAAIALAQWALAREKGQTQRGDYGFFRSAMNKLYDVVMGAAKALGLKRLSAEDVFGTILSGKAARRGRTLEEQGVSDGAGALAGEKPQGEAPAGEKTRAAFAGVEGADRLPEPKRAQARADLEAAKAMAEEWHQGRDEALADDQVEKIRLATGWFPAGDGKWRREFSDDAMRLNPDVQKRLNTFGRADDMLGDLIEHPELFRIYPAMRVIDTTIDIAPTERGQYNRQNGSIRVQAPNIKRALYVLLHEIQHSIQEREGFAVGGSPAMMEKKREQASALMERFKSHPEFPEAQKAYQKVQDDYLEERITKEQADEKIASLKELYPVLRFYKEAEGRFSEYSHDPHDLYHRLHGEQEAGAAMWRRTLSPEERQAQTPKWWDKNSITLSRNGTEMLHAGDKNETRASIGMDKGQDERDLLGDTVSRGRPSEEIVYKRPLAGPSGAKIVSYVWRSRAEEDASKAGDGRVRRVSDWDSAARSSHTGRDIVHQFSVEMPDGKRRVVSAESAFALLGYNDTDSTKFKSVVTASRTLGGLLRRLDGLRNEKAALDRIREEVARQPLPKIERATAGFAGNPQAAKLRMEDAFVIQQEAGPITPERQRSLAEAWRSRRVAEKMAAEGFRSPSETNGIAGEISDVERRIEAAKRKTDETSQPLEAPPAPALERTKGIARQTALIDESAPEAPDYRQGRIEGRQRDLFSRASAAADEENQAKETPEFTPKDWPANFPNVAPFTNIKTMYAHPDYSAAKSGDRDAAYRLVAQFLRGKKQIEKIRLLKEKYPNAILLPVHAEEATGRNAIPIRLADALGVMTGLRVGTDIVQSSKPERTGKDAWYRLANRPAFDGPVIPGQDYILLDDAAARGGTLGELRHYIERNGGHAVAMYVMGAGQFSANIQMAPKTKLALEQRMGRESLRSLLREQGIYGGDHEYLTESEARTLLASENADAARNRILASRHAPGSRIIPGVQPSTRESDQAAGRNEVVSENQANAELPAAESDIRAGNRDLSANETGSDTRASIYLDGEPIWHQTRDEVEQRSRWEDDPERRTAMIGDYERNVRHAMNGGDILRAVLRGDFPKERAIAVIDSAGLKVPPEIRNARQPAIPLVSQKERDLSRELEALKKEKAIVDRIHQEVDGLPQPEITSSAETTYDPHIFRMGDAIYRSYDTETITPEIQKKLIGYWKENRFKDHLLKSGADPRLADVNFERAIHGLNMDLKEARNLFDPRMGKAAGEGPAKVRQIAEPGEAKKELAVAETPYRASASEEPYAEQQDALAGDRGEPKNGIIRRFIDRMSESKDRKALNLGLVNDADSERILKQTGEDVSGAVRKWSPMAILRVLERHGGEAEESAGRSRVKPEDLELAAEIYASPDEIRLIPGSQDRENILQYRKRIGGEDYYLEEKHTDHDTLALDSFWKRPAADEQMSEETRGASGEHPLSSEFEEAPIAGDEQAGHPGEYGEHGIPIPDIYRESGKFTGPETELEQDLREAQPVYDPKDLSFWWDRIKKEKDKAEARQAKWDDVRRAIVELAKKMLPNEARRNNLLTILGKPGEAMTDRMLEKARTVIEQDLELHQAREANQKLGKTFGEYLPQNKMAKRTAPAETPPARVEKMFTPEEASQYQAGVAEDSRHWRREQLNANPTVQEQIKAEMRSWAARLYPAESNQREAIMRMLDKPGRLSRKSFEYILSRLLDRSDSLPTEARMQETQPETPRRDILPKRNPTGRINSDEMDPELRAIYKQIKNGMKNGYVTGAKALAAYLKKHPENTFGKDQRNQAGDLLRGGELDHLAAMEGKRLQNFTKNDQAMIPGMKAEASAYEKSLLYDAMQHAHSLNRMQNEMTLLDAQGERRDAREVVVQEVKENAKNSLTGDFGTQKGAGPIRAAVLGHLNPRTLAGELSKRLKEVIIYGIERAQRGMAQMHREWSKTRETALRNAGLDPGSEELTHWMNDIGEFTTGDKTFNATRAQLVHLYAMQSDPETMAMIRRRDIPGTAVMFKGRPHAESLFLTADELAGIGNLLTDGERGIVEAFKKYNRDKVSNPLWQATMALKGRVPDFTPDYYPRAVYFKSENSDMPTDVGARMMKAVENTGILERRAQDHSRPLEARNVLETMDDYMKDSRLVVHMGKPFRMAKLVLEHDNVKRAIEAAIGAQGYKNLAQNYLLDAIEVNRRPPTGWYDKGLQWLAHNLSTSVLQLNVSSIMKNVFGGTIKTIGEFDYQDWEHGVRHAFGKETFQRMMENDPLMWERFEGGQLYRQYSPLSGGPSEIIATMSLADALKAAKTAAKAGKIGALGRAAKAAFERLPFMEWGDSVPFRSMWAAVEHETERLHPDLSGEARMQHILDRFRDVAYRTQNGNSASETSALASMWRQHPGRSLLLMFTSDSNKSFNMLHEAWSEAVRNKDPKRFLRTLTAVGLDTAANIAISTGLKFSPVAIGALLAGRMLTDDEKKKAGGELAWQTVQQATGPLYFANMLEDWAKAALVEHSTAKAMESGQSPIGRLQIQATDALVSASKAAFSDWGKEIESGPKKGESKQAADLWRALEGTLTTGMVATGIPGTTEWWRLRRLLTAMHGEDPAVEFGKEVKRFETARKALDTPAVRATLESDKQAEYRKDMQETRRFYLAETDIRQVDREISAEKAKVNANPDRIERLRQKRKDIMERTLAGMYSPGALREPAGYASTAQASERVEKINPYALRQADRNQSQTRRLY